ncbi:MAG: hypothetical protein KDA25_06870, partial [Phycisphaerales bacterium]|nr:hypothetical protein [Phycisphaerales bacterium]
MITLATITLSMLLSGSGEPGTPTDDHGFVAYQAGIAAAEKSLRLGETRELRRWLDACPPAYRGWEWRHLDSITDTTTRTVPTVATPIRIVMAPSGDRCATVEGAAVRIRSWPDLAEITVIDGHDDAVYRAEFSPDGRRLITVSRDVTARTWDLDTGAEIARIDLANPAFAAATFDPTGAVAATCAWERDDAGSVFGVVWLWDPRTGDVLRRVRVGVKPLSAIRFTPDGAHLVVGSWDGLVHVLDADADETVPLSLPDEGIYNAVNDVAVSPDGHFVAAASKDRTTRVFDLATGDLVATLRGHLGYVEGVSFSPDGATLATSSIDATIALWTVGDWSRRTILRGSTGT